jgi:hypothetical protein
MATRGGIMRDPILVTGAARSGTSLTAGVLNICGAWGGEMAGPNENNKKGMFENIFIRQNLTKPYLRELGVDPMGQNPLPNLTDINVLRKLVEDGPKWALNVVGALKEQGLGESTPWFYKGAKMCLIWPLWHSAFPKAKWIIVRRNAEDIARCCMRTSFMRNLSTEAEWIKWAEYHEQLFNDMLSNGLDIQFNWPDKAVSGDFSELRGIVEDLGLTWHDKEVRDFVAPELWDRR